MVGERRTLRVAGGARRVLDVDGVVGPAPGLAGVQFSRAHMLRPGGQIIPAPHSGGRCRVPVVMGRYEDDVAEVRECGAVQAAGRRARQLRYQLVHHCHVVGCAEASDQHQGGELRLFQEVRQLVGAVGGIDVDQHRADLGGGKLGQDPLGVVGGPDSDVLALFDSDGHQATGDALNLRVKLEVGEPVSGGRVDQGFPIGVTIGLQVQHVADGAPRFNGGAHVDSPYGTEARTPPSMRRIGPGARRFRLPSDGPMPSRR